MEASTPNLGHFLSVDTVLARASFPLKCQELEDDNNPGGSRVLGGSQYSISTSITVSHLEEDLAKKYRKPQEINCCVGVAMETATVSTTKASCLLGNLVFL